MKRAGGARRLSVSNNIDVLRDKLFSNMARKENYKKEVPSHFTLY